MSKKLINEDIKSMKYLFGYKPGRVISEQDFDYTTDDYLDTTEMDEEGKRYPERLVRHSDTGKLVGSHKRGEGFRPSPHGEELGFDIHPTDIPHGTKFGGAEVGDFDYEDDDFGVPMDEETDFDGFDLSDLGLDDDDYMDDFDREDNEYEDRLPRRMTEQFDDRDHDTTMMLRRKSSRVVRKFLESLDTGYQDVTMISLVNCEYANFSGINICDLPQLLFINLNGTRNNFEEQGYECANSDSEEPSFYFINE